MTDGRFVYRLPLHYFVSLSLLALIPFGLTFTFLCSRRVVIVMDMEILQSADKTGGKIGNPTPYNADGMASHMCIDEELQ